MLSWQPISPFISEYISSYFAYMFNNMCSLYSIGFLFKRFILFEILAQSQNFPDNPRMSLISIYFFINAFLSGTPFILNVDKFNNSNN